MMLAFGAMTAMISQSAFGASSSQAAAEQAALSQCVSLRTTGADRILTARWLFAVMSKSPQIADLSTVSAERSKDLNQGFAKLITRLVAKVLCLVDDDRVVGRPKSVYDVREREWHQLIEFVCAGVIAPDLSHDVLT
jgi:hypothetical protein